MTRQRPPGKCVRFLFRWITQVIMALGWIVRRYLTRNTRTDVETPILETSNLENSFDSLRLTTREPRHPTQFPESLRNK